MGFIECEVRSVEPRLSRGRGRDWLEGGGEDSGRRATHDFFFVLPHDVQPGIDNDNPSMPIA